MDGIRKDVCGLLLVAGQWIDGVYLCYQYSYRKQASTDHGMASSKIRHL